ncbi:hypothetical protein BKA70DRAFT_1188480 [Coprinopsis sp. MPI-PUGE-AT-0042]|nr:hypothetical protein BKA70DRAFT_1188480 [Coprinopsis sp. MPI-PUGE-AT-0042]
MHPPSFTVKAPEVTSKGAFTLSGSSDSSRLFPPIFRLPVHPPARSKIDDGIDSEEEENESESSSALLSFVAESAQDSIRPLPSAVALVTNSTNTHINARSIAVAGRDLNVIQLHFPNPERTTASHPLDALQAIVAWLAAPNYRNIHIDNCTKRTDGTGEWLLSEEFFLVWLDLGWEYAYFIWGTGMPGAGKTLLSCFAIEYLERRRKAPGGEGIAVAYAYIRYTEPVTVRDLISALVCQLLERHSDALLPIFYPVYARHRLEGTKPSEQELHDLLITFRSALGVCFFIIDGLDEAHVRLQGALLQLLTSIGGRLLVMSRPMKTLEAQHTQADVFPVAAHTEDINLLIAEQISRDADLQDVLACDGQMRAEIISTIQKRSGGMFLHASLQVAALSGRCTIKNIRNVLEQVPPGLQNMYQATIRRIEEQPKDRAEIAQRALLWLLYGRAYPASNRLPFLCRAVATCPETNEYDPDLVVTPKVLVSACCGLVVLENKSSVVRLIHVTAYDALRAFLASKYPDPNGMIAIVCAKYLIRCNLHSSRDSKIKILQHLEADNFLRYAYTNWWRHARHSSKISRETLVKEFVLHCTSFPIFEEDLDCDYLKPVHVAAYYGFPEAFERSHWEAYTTVTTPVQKWAPLTLACLHGHGEATKTMVNLLLALPTTDINLPDDYGHTPLHAAAHSRNEVAVRALLQHPDIDMNRVTERFNLGTPMMCALMGLSSGEYLPIITALLEHPNIRINEVDNRGRSVLINACLRHGSDRALLKQLLEHPGIEVNLVDSMPGETALMRASRYGFRDAVEMLLDTPGIDVHATNKKGDTALSIAQRALEGAHWGHQRKSYGAIVTLLKEFEERVERSTA